ncbi:hypothetical protein B0H17DRAFT_1287862, partial [Mycena rosella]
EDERPVGPRVGVVRLRRLAAHYHLCDLPIRGLTAIDIERMVYPLHPWDEEDGAELVDGLGVGARVDSLPWLHFGDHLLQHALGERAVLPERLRVLHVQVGVGRASVAPGVKLLHQPTTLLLICHCHLLPPTCTLPLQVKDPRSSPVRRRTLHHLPCHVHTPLIHVLHEVLLRRVPCCLDGGLEAVPCAAVFLVYQMVRELALAEALEGQRVPGFSVSFAFHHRFECGHNLLSGTCFSIHRLIITSSHVIAANTSPSLVYPPPSGSASNSVPSILLNSAQSVPLQFRHGTTSIIGGTRLMTLIIGKCRWCPACVPGRCRTR